MTAQEVAHVCGRNTAMSFSSRVGKEEYGELIEELKVKWSGHNKWVDRLIRELAG